MQAEAGVALAEGRGGEAAEGGTAPGGGQEPASYRLHYHHLYSHTHAHMLYHTMHVLHIP